MRLRAPHLGDRLRKVVRTVAGDSASAAPISSVRRPRWAARITADSRLVKGLLPVFNAVVTSSVSKTCSPAATLRSLLSARGGAVPAAFLTTRIARLLLVRKSIIVALMAYFVFMLGVPAAHGPLLALWWAPCPSRPYFRRSRSRSATFSNEACASS